MTELSLEADLDRAAELIAVADVVALACHIAPDGDALGSMLAMHHLCRANGTVSIASFPEPFVVAPHYLFLPGLDLITKPADFPAAPELMMTFDCGSLGRLGELANPARAATELIVVDHHLSNDRYGTLNVIDVDAAATAVVVRQLADRLGWSLNRDAALCLYTGLVTDTGRFQYQSTTPAVFRLAAELAEFDLPIASMSRALFEEHHLDYLQMAGECLSHAALDADLGFVAAWISADDMVRHHVSIEETEGFIDLVRRTSEADVSCVLKETPDGIRVSLRSLDTIDVSAIAAGFGGGGHRYAAGFSADGTVADVLDAVRIAVRAARAARSVTADGGGAPTVDGLVVVDKPTGCTSHDVVGRCRRIFGMKRVGHAGTLDPDATGVLLVGLGRATRLLKFIADLPKTYIGEIVLGTSTTTLDAAGEVTGTWDMSGVTLADVAVAAKAFIGDIEQIPPMVSAVQVGGKRLHQLARAGIEIERAPRPVTVYRFDALGEVEPGVFRVEAECSTGTYIRTLADDLGRALGGGAHLRNLRRTRIGPFGDDIARTLDVLGPADVLAPAAVVAHLPSVTVDAAGAADVACGRSLGESGCAEGPVAVLDEAGTLLAVYRNEGARFIADVVLAAT